MTPTSLTIQEYHGFKILIDKRLVTLMELDQQEAKAIASHYDDLPLVTGCIVQVFTGKLQFKAEGPHPYLTKHVSRKEWLATDATMSHQEIATTLQILKQTLGLDWIVDKFSELLEQNYEMTTNQAQAMIYKLVGQKLDSTARTHLYQLRQKVMKYRPLVENFSSLLLTPEEQSHDSLHQFGTTGSFVSDIRDHRYTLVSPGVPLQKKYNTANPVENGLYRVEEVRGEKRMVLPFSRLEFRCQSCSHSEILDIETIMSDEVEKRYHHDQEMLMLLQE